MCQSRQPWASEETSGLAQLKYLNEACNGSLMLGTYCTALYCTVLYSTVEVKVGNHRIPSANYLAIIGMISGSSKTPFPIPTPFQKSLVLCGLGGNIIVDFIKIDSGM